MSAESDALLEIARSLDRIADELQERRLAYTGGPDVSDVSHALALIAQVFERPLQRIANAMEEHSRG